MNVLRRLENMIAGLVEGTFGRVFKAEVRPMELARKLAREMDENKTTSVSRVYAPNEYSVWLSPRDRARYEGVEHEVIEELCAYLLEHARGEGLALAARLHIDFHTDEQLALGEFGIEARLAKPQEQAQEEPSSARRRAVPARAGEAELPVAADLEDLEAEPESGSTMIFSGSRRVREAVEGTRARRRAKALLLVAGKRVSVPPRGATLGRSRDCDIVLEDSSVSRRHAELQPIGGDGASWTLHDLGSTNGVRVNGTTVRRAQELRSGDRIEMGSTELLFEIAP